MALQQLRDSMLIPVQPQPLSAALIPQQGPLKIDDRLYLTAVVSHLKDTRVSQSIKVAPLSKKAALKTSVIQQAEAGTFIPTSAQMKAWALALGIAWEDLWRDTMARLASGWSPPAPTPN